MLDAEWVRAHADEFDVMHVHFGFDHKAPEALRQLVDALREHRKPLVLTVHDLRNPHHGEPRAPRRAARGPRLGRRRRDHPDSRGRRRDPATLGPRTRHVLPHPHVVDEPTLSRPRREHDGFVIGVHVKSLRANMDPLPVIEHDRRRPCLRCPARVLRVDAHTDVMTHTGHPHGTGVSRAGLARLDAAGLIDLHVHDYFTDDELWDYLSGLDVSVLPYRFGTHSGWLEACFDLGTTVLAPDCGYYAEQRPCVTYAVPGTATRNLEVPTLTAALLRLYRERPAWRADPGGAPGGTTGLAQAHEAIYAASAGRERRMHVVMIAAARFPLKEPFAGGLESLTWHLCRGLRDRGVRVSVFAGPGSDPHLGRPRDAATRPLDLSAAARQDVAMPPAVWLGEHHAYLQVMLELQRRGDVDVIHNNSLHHLPVAMAVACTAPMVTTLHTPPTPWLEPAIEIADDPRSHFVAVSEHTRAVLAARRRRGGGPQRGGRAPVAAGTGRGRPGLGGAPGAREGTAPGDRRRACSRQASPPRRSDR